jgi:hypothetical protein
MFKRFATLALLAILLSTTTRTALAGPPQSSGPKTGDRLRERQREFLEQFLADTISEIETLSRNENRLLLFNRIQSAALKINPARGKALARRVIDLASAAAREDLQLLAGDLLDVEQRREAGPREQKYFQIYFNSLRLLADLDPEMARLALVETRDRLDDPDEGRHNQALAQLEYHIETKVLSGRETDPGAMAEALRRCFDAAEIGEFRSVLKRFAKKFPDAAIIEVESLMTRLGKSESNAWYTYNFPKVVELLQVIAEEFPTGLERLDYRQFNPGTLGERSRATFFTVLADAGLATVINAQRASDTPRAGLTAFRQFEEYAGGFARYAPEQARQFALVLAEKKPDRNRKEGPPPVVPATGPSIGEILADASEATTAEFVTLIEKAAEKLASGGHIAEGREVLGRIPNGFLRRSAERTYDIRHPKTRPAEPGSARRIHLVPETSGQKFRRLMGAGRNALERRDPGAAAGDLNEALYVAGGKIPGSLEHLQYLFELADAFAEFEPATAEDIAGNIIDKMNTALDAAAVLDGFLPNAPKAQILNNEFQLETMSPVAGNFLGVGAVIAKLGKNNPDTLAPLLGRVSRSEIRARLRAEVLEKLAEAVLER